MFGKILGKKKSETKSDDNSALIEKISKMNLTEMRAYVKENLDEFKVTTYGLNRIMKRLTTLDEKSKTQYLKSDDMDSKEKKAFDLVLLIAADKRADIETIELVQKFQKIYKDIIESYDKKYKEIYSSRFDDAIKTGLANIKELSKLRNKMDILGE